MRPNIPDPAYQTLKTWISTCNALVAQEMPWRGKPDAELLGVMLFIIMTGTVTVDGQQMPADANGLRAWLRASAEWKQHNSTPGPAPGPTPGQQLPELRTDRKVFTTINGVPWRWKGVTAFGLPGVFARGGDIRPFLRAYPGFNVARSWQYVQGNAWAGKAWDVRDVDMVADYINACADEGFFVEWTLLTDDKSDRLAFAKEFVPKLAKKSLKAKPFLEGGNEPQTHKDIKTGELKAVLKASGFFYTSGDYEDTDKTYGTYGVDHSPRNDEWARHPHRLMEFWSGAGPTRPGPKLQFPWVEDEPGKLQDVGVNEAEWRAYFGACALFGAGATFHSETGKYGQLPTNEERKVAKYALDALNAFPADAANGSYKRIDEANAPEEGRTYVIGGKYMVRCHQRGTEAPLSGWKPLDNLGVLWKK